MKILYDNTLIHTYIKIYRNRHLAPVYFIHNPSYSLHRHFHFLCLENSVFSLTSFTNLFIENSKGTTVCNFFIIASRSCNKIMASFMLSLVVFLVITGHSCASYCVCKDGVDEKILQENIDYACGSGADCTAIHQGGACYNPDTIKDHCSYAVNSYYQRKGGSGASCDFKGTATLSSNAPSSTSGCVYQSTAGGGSTTPTTGTTNPSTGGTGTGTGTSTSTGTGTGMGTGTGTTTTGTNPVFGLGPTGSGMTDTSTGTTTLHQSSSILFTMALVFTSFVYLRV